MSGRARGRSSGGRGQPSPSTGRGGGGPGRGRGRGSSQSVVHNAPPPSQPVPPIPTVPVSSLSGEVEQKLTLQPSASSSEPVAQPVQQAPHTEATQSQQQHLPPASSKSIRIPARPGFGTVGTRMIVKANHFLVEVADRDLSHYDVSVLLTVLIKSHTLYGNSKLFYSIFFW